MGRKKESHFFVYLTFACWCLMSALKNRAILLLFRCLILCWAQCWNPPGGINLPSQHVWLASVITTVRMDLDVPWVAIASLYILDREKVKWRQKIQAPSLRFCFSLRLLFDFNNIDIFRQIHNIVSEQSNSFNLYHTPDSPLIRVPFRVSFFPNLNLHNAAVSGY